MYLSISDVEDEKFGPKHRTCIAFTVNKKLLNPAIVRCFTIMYTHFCISVECLPFPY